MFVPKLRFENFPMRMQVKNQIVSTLLVPLLLCVSPTQTTLYAVGQISN